ncbi:MAG: methyltransferase domain-containing protein [Proteiniphilum sp.]|nr:methyltransferase domain-containing protein [Proteiniphilum sp.]
MSIITITSCPVCGSSDIEKVFDSVDHFSSREVFPICDCRECGFRFTNNFPSEDVIGKYYDSPAYISHSDSDKGLTNRMYHLFRRLMLRRKVNLVKRHLKRDNAHLLDIGCGTGYFLNAAKEKGFTVSGIEKDEKAREKAITRFKLDVKEETGFFATDQTSFDVVTLWHVLEHLEKLNESIEKMVDILTPDGTMVIALPNHRSFDAKWYKEKWAAYDTPRHLWHLTPDTLERLLAKHNLSVVKKYRMPLDAYYVALLSEQYLGSTVLIKYLRAFLIGTTGFLLSLFNLKQSSSVIYIVKKSIKLEKPYSLTSKRVTYK